MNESNVKENQQQQQQAPHEEKEESKQTSQDGESLVEYLKTSQLTDMVRKFKKGFVPLQLQRKNQLSHPLLDRLHMLLLQMIHANQDNLVTGETPFAVQIVKVICEILSYKTRSKMFFRERTIYEIFDGLDMFEVRCALKYFELHEFAKRDAFNPPSFVWVQFMLESGDFLKFMYMLLGDEAYLGTCYDPLSIVCNKFYREDLLSELALLSQVRFWFGFLTRPLSKEEQPSREQLLEDLKNTSKEIVRFFIDSKLKNSDASFTDLGDESKTREVGQLIRYKLHPAVEAICNHGIQNKSYSAGPYHIWNLIESRAKQLSKRMYHVFTGI